MAVEERRQQPRFAVSLRCGWTAATHFHLAEVSNLSIGGCRVDTRLPPPPIGHEVTLVIDLADDSELALAGHVSWMQAGQGFGLAFVSASAAKRARLKAYLLSHPINAIR